MKFLRVVRLDDSDGRVFPAAACPGEWAVPGAFAFWQSRPESLTGKLRTAFTQGFVGTESGRLRLWSESGR